MAAEEKDIMKTQTQMIANKMTKIANLVAQLKAEDAEIKQLRERGKTWYRNPPGTVGKWKEGKRIYDKGCYLFTHRYAVNLTSTIKTYKR